MLKPNITMDKKTCIITGCNTGIGKITAIELAKQNFEILMLVRDSEKSRKAFEDIKRESNSESVKLYYVNLSSFNSIKKVVEQVKKEHTKVDVLINNAGVYKRSFEKSADGFELTMAVNYSAIRHQKKSY
ncbi:MAG: SDR family NAD(P)-dependent oxidoreductase [bacterium]|nr:SDR family NAD(P)-dependent oxidoreductase [bacterium]